MEKNSNIELMEDFCKQYTVNNGKTGSLLISTITALFVVFTGYGISLALYAELTFIATVASILVLDLFSGLAVYFGYSRRRDQYITFSYSQRLSDNNYYLNGISCGQGKCWFCFLPDFYNHLYWFYLFLTIIISIYSAIFIHSKSTLSGAQMWITIAMGSVSFFFQILSRSCYYFKYLCLCQRPCICRNCHFQENINRNNNENQ